MVNYTLMNILYLLICLTAFLTFNGAVYAADNIIHPNQTLQNEYKQLRAVRAKLDETVWSLEIQGLKYEKIFVQFWDNLRKTNNSYETIKKFPLKSIQIGTNSEIIEYDQGISEIKYLKFGKTLNKKKWDALLKSLEKKGYMIEQTEWHHSKFSFQNNNPMSLFNFEIHATKNKSAWRGILKGSFEVMWIKSKEQLLPQNIKLIAFSLFERQIKNSKFDEIFLLPKKGRLISGSEMPLLVYDLNGDGLSEIVVPSANKVYWNKGEMKFVEEQLLDSPLLDIGTALLTDLNNDGWVDLVVTILHGHLTIFYGQEGGTFERVGTKLVLDQTLSVPLSLTSGDFNKDGLVDLWIGQYKSPFFMGHMPTPFFDANDGFPAYLLKNKGNGQFEDITLSANLGKKRFRRTYSSSFIDINGDSFLDLLVISDFSGIDLYLNNGNETFREVTDQVIDERSGFGMSHSFGDYNLDGLTDIFMAGMSSTTARRLLSMGLERKGFKKYKNMIMPMGFGNRMFLARGEEGVFEQYQFKDQVSRSGWSWGSSSFDFDNDGDLDVYIGNGYLSQQSAEDYCTHYWRHDIYASNSGSNNAYTLLFEKTMEQLTRGEISWNGFEHNHLFMNIAGKKFLNIAFLLGIASEDDTRSVVTEDFDLDGRMDLLFSDRLGTVHFFKNNLQTGHHWIGINFTSIESSALVGAKIILEYPAGKQIHHVVNGDSFLSQHSNQIHFGLGKHKKVALLTIHWANGLKTKIKKPAIDQYHQVDYTKLVTKPLKNLTE